VICQPGNRRFVGNFTILCKFIKVFLLVLRL
jgi:hypothetical protein